MCAHTHSMRNSNQILCCDQIDLRKMFTWLTTLHAVAKMFGDTNAEVCCLQWLTFLIIFCLVNLGHQFTVFGVAVSHCFREVLSVECPSFMKIL